MAIIETELPNIVLPDFWTRSMPEIEADLALLRAARTPLFFEDPYSANPGARPGTWVVTRHAQILDMSRRADVFSSAEGITVLDAPPEFNEYFGSMIAMDDPRHARLRRLVSAGFTPRMLAKLEDSVQEQATLVVDEVIEHGECDFVTEVAARLPLRIVCDLMGVPGSQLDFVFEQSNVVLGVSDPEYAIAEESAFTSLLNAGQALTDLMADVAESKKGTDSDDLTSLLVNAELEEDQLSDADLASFFILLVVAGNETTRNAISWGLHYLTEHPEQKALWMDDFEGRAPSAVEEIVRLASPVTYMRRTALADTQVGGVDIAAGEKLCMFYLAANRDEDVFEDPYRFDILRDPNPQMGFGGPGPHFCLGAHLARREITVVFRELFDRVPDIAATGPYEPLRAAFIHGVKHMPAAFTPGPRRGH